MLGKMLVFTFCILGIFALLMGMIPVEFYENQAIYNPSYRDVDIEEEFEANSMLVYDNTGADNMTYEYTSLEDGPSPPDWEAGLPDNQFLEIGWGPITRMGYVLPVPSILARHRQRNWFLSAYWYSTIEDCTFYSKTGTDLGLVLFKDDVETYWDTDTNSSAFVAKSTQIQTNLILKRFDAAQTIGENWDDGHLQYYITYDINFTASGPSAFSIVGSLLTFQAPSLGIPGTFGTMMNMIIAIPLWSCIAYIVYKIIAGLIPFMSGGSGD